MRILPLLALMLAVPAARAQDSTEIDPVNSFEAQVAGSQPMPGCHGDMCGRVPVPLSNAMLMAPGEWMMTVRVERRRFVGTLDGHTSVGTGEIFGQGFMMAPRDMDMTMTMLEGMVGLDEDNTFMAMLPYVQNKMTMVMDDGMEFDMRASGLGDLQAGVTHRTWEGVDQRVVFYAGVSVPTGSVDEKDSMPGFPGSTVDYIMEPGTGTFDLRPALTWLSDGGLWNFGAQLQWVHALGDNSENWHWGDREDFSVWTVRETGEDSSASLRVTAHKWGDVHGSDDDLDPTMSPTQDPDLQGGRRIETALGFRTGDLVAEFGVPISEKLDGPQLSENWFATLGWQFSF
ncbi:MAG TPA: transporter [Planctomycetota bacterium]|nr:transporter [Planctomycetota bacterium]